MTGAPVRIIVNHLTRMEKGYICVAGIDKETMRHVRPVLDGRLSTAFLARNSGPFDIACIVDLGPTTHVGRPPEMEDYGFESRKAARSGTISPDNFWKLLAQLARNRLSEIFGPELTQRGQSSCAVDVGQGHASLGCMVTTNRPTLYLKSRPDRPEQIRIHLRDDEFDLDLSVTDIRFYRDDHVTPNHTIVSQVARRLERGIGVILSIGLTRPFTPSDDLPPVHWLQVNNIHLEDNPTWRLG